MGQVVPCQQSKGTIGNCKINSLVSYHGHGFCCRYCVVHYSDTLLHGPAEECHIDSMAFHGSTVLGLQNN